MDENNKECPKLSVNRNTLKKRITSSDNYQINNQLILSLMSEFLIISSTEVQNADCKGHVMAKYSALPETPNVSLRSYYLVEKTTTTKTCNKLVDCKLGNEPGF